MKECLNILNTFYTDLLFVYNTIQFMLNREKIKYRKIKLQIKYTSYIYKKLTKISQQNNNCNFKNSGIIKIYQNIFNIYLHRTITN